MLQLATIPIMREDSGVDFRLGGAVRLLFLHQLASLEFIGVLYPYRSYTDKFTKRKLLDWTLLALINLYYGVPRQKQFVVPHTYMRRYI